MRFLAFLFLAFLLPATVSAGPLEDARAANARQDYQTAVNLLLPLAEQGNAEAQYSLGVMHEEGWGVPQSYAEAMKWYRKAADQEAPLAQMLLGMMYYTGQGVPQDYAEAANWLKKSAEQGQPSAQYILGTMYADGEGIKKDKVEAYKWLSLGLSRGVYFAKDGLKLIDNKMTPEQIEEGKRRASEWKLSKKP